ncbi:Acetate--CoA ligase [ADP-forming] [Candidatus Gugararchaeum adminiculabundum]|nr:Acetate--CoA ligase [ADP-forming] [Candidatus Gugararchaeum adminiculabundum]
MPGVEAIGGAKTIAIVGLSRDSAKYSNEVARYLQSVGKRIVPVNPSAAGEEILGEKCFASISEIEDGIAKEIEIIDVFRKSEETGQIIDEAIENWRKKRLPKLKVIWLQLGIMNKEGGQKTRKAGIGFVENRCVEIEHERLAGKGI